MTDFEYDPYSSSRMKAIRKVNKDTLIKVLAFSVVFIIGCGITVTAFTYMLMLTRPLFWRLFNWIDSLSWVPGVVILIVGLMIIAYWFLIGRKK